MSPFDPQMILLYILAVATYSLVGLLAIWAGLGRPHWFLRVAVVGGILLLLLLIPAYEPLLLFSIQSAVVILPLMLLKSFGRRSQSVGPDGGTEAGATARIRPQFSLLDLLLLPVVVAVIVAVAVSVPSDTYDRIAADLLYLFDVSITPAAGWSAMGLCGLGFGISTLAAAWVALGRRRLWLRLILLCLVPTSALMAGWLALLRASGWLARGRGESVTASPTGGATRPRVRRLAKLGAVLLSLLILLPPVATFCVLVASVPDPSENVLPDPNGYDDLMKAAEPLQVAAEPDLDTATSQQLQAFLTGYRDVLDTARTGLDRECVVPLKYSTSDVFDVGGAQGLRALARAFLAEGKLAEMNARPAEAAESYLDIIRLAQAGSRGGLLIDWLVGEALIGIAVDALTGLRETLTPDQCHELIDTLETLNANRERPEDVLARDQLWERIVFGWKAQLMHSLSMIAGSESDLRALLESIENRHQAELRLLICGLALRSYSVENGQPPEKLADLVPEYLAEVPEDLYSGKPLVYRREAAGYVLYSVGRDGRDNGGQPGPYGYGLKPGTDMLLDKPGEEQEE